MITISTSLVFIIDQLTSLWVAEVLLNEEDLSPGFSDLMERADFGFDVSYLMHAKSRSFGKDDEVISNFSQAFRSFSANRDYQLCLTLMSNMTLAWIIMHEIAHIRLGHIGAQKFSEWSHSDSEDQSERERIELEADTWSIHGLLMFCSREDFRARFGIPGCVLFDKWVRSITMACAVATALMDKYSHYIRSTKGPSKSHPSSSLRFFNLMVCINNHEISLDRYLTALEEAQPSAVLRLKKPQEPTSSTLLLSVINIDWLYRRLQLYPVFSGSGITIDLDFSGLIRSRISADPEPIHYFFEQLEMFLVEVELCSCQVQITNAGLSQKRKRWTELSLASAAAFPNKFRPTGFMEGTKLASLCTNDFYTRLQVISEVTDEQLVGSIIADFTDEIQYSISSNQHLADLKVAAEPTQSKDGDSMTIYMHEPLFVF